MNLTQLPGYVGPSPQDYKVPQLFDNYNNGNFNISGLKKNP